VLSIAFQCFDSDVSKGQCHLPNCATVKKERLQMGAGFFKKNGNSLTSAVKLEVKLCVSFAARLAVFQRNIM
jgi:hypothetical protein